jgi:hypothetical protein
VVADALMRCSRPRRESAGCGAFVEDDAGLAAHARNELDTVDTTPSSGLSAPLSDLEKGDPGRQFATMAEHPEVPPTFDSVRVGNSAFGNE